MARGLFNKAVTLGSLDKSEESISIYDEIENRYGMDESRGVRELVAKARNGLAFWRIASAKQHWQDANRKSALLAAAIKALASALLVCEDDDRAMVSGKLGYALFLHGDRLPRWSQPGTALSGVERRHFLFSRKTPNGIAWNQKTAISRHIWHVYGRSCIRHRGRPALAHREILEKNQAAAQ